MGGQWQWQQGAAASGGRGLDSGGAGRLREQALGAAAAAGQSSRRQQEAAAVDGCLPDDARLTAPSSVFTALPPCPALLVCPACPVSTLQLPDPLHPHHQWRPHLLQGAGTQCGARCLCRVHRRHHRTGQHACEEGSLQQQRPFLDLCLPGWLAGWVRWLRCRASRRVV